jgi:phenylpyruvate tautomerase PptA (4-oxalocrotonate tautomerase family)
MPILDVTLVVEPDEELASDLAQMLADAAGHALRSLPGQTWLRLHVFGRDQYAENQSPLQPKELPVFVTVLKRHAASPEELASEIAALTDAIARVISRPVASVHIEFAPPAIGRLAFGGQLVE